MEEFDDLVQTPDENGSLELTYRGWPQADEVVWTMGRELVSLNLSYNVITSLPPELGDLHLLKELNVACNKLERIPKQIGKLRQLTILKINGNKIEVIPEEIGACHQMERFIASENRLKSLPMQMMKMRKLELLQLANNDLDMLPASICRITTIKSIDVLNNPGIQYMIPKKHQDNTEYIMWACGIWYRHQEEVALINNCSEAYGRLIDFSDEAMTQQLAKHDLIHDNTRDLLEEMPKGCVFYIAKAITMVCDCIHRRER